MIKIVKGGLQYLSNLSSKEKESIMEDLTLKNPAYEQAKAYGRGRFTNIDKFLMFYQRVGKDLVVPRGYRVKFNHKVISDERVERKVLYPNFKLKLRQTQQEAYDTWTKDKEKSMLVLPTGKGKSILGCYMAYATRQRTLVVVQKDDLIDGWMNDFALCFGLPKGEKIGVIKAKKFKIGSQITLATIQTLAKMPEEKKMELYDKFGMVILDECHHSVAKSYEIFKRFNCKHLIGLTATDEIKGGLRPVQYWIIGEVGYRCKESADDEDIMPYSVIVRKSKLKYDPPQMYYYGRKVVDETEAEALREAGKKVKRKPLDPQELKALLKDPDFNLQVAYDIKREYEARKSCIAFLHEKEHIRYLKDVLTKIGVPESQIQLYYGDSKVPDAVMKQKAESKEVLITIATFSKATEGTNVKSWERAFLVTSINNAKNTKQAVGRIRRRKEGKVDAVVYDYTHPNVKGMSSHIKTRMTAYRDNKAKIIGYENNTKKPSPIRRGFRPKN